MLKQKSGQKLRIKRETEEKNRDKNHHHRHSSDEIERAYIRMIEISTFYLGTATKGSMKRARLSFCGEVHVVEKI